MLVLQFVAANGKFWTLTQQGVVINMFMLCIYVYVLCWRKYFRLKIFESIYQDLSGFIQNPPLKFPDSKA